MKILNLGGKNISAVPYLITFKGYYLPPKRDLNFMFIKGFLNGKSKVR